MDPGHELYITCLQTAHRNVQQALDMVYGYPHPTIKRGFWTRRILLKVQNLLIKQVIKERNRARKEEGESSQSQLPV